MEKTKTNVPGILSLILGIVSIITCCINLTLFISVPGIVLGILGTALPYQKKGIAIAGLIVSICGLVIYFTLIVFMKLFDESWNEIAKAIITPQYS